jgi:hypothetical protein
MGLSLAVIQCMHVSDIARREDVLVQSEMEEQRFPLV